MSSPIQPNSPIDVDSEETRASVPRRSTSMAEIPKAPQSFNDIAEVIAKIMILGDSGTGKSKLFCRLRKRPFNPHYNPTPGIDFATHIVKISNGKHMRAQIVDTSGLDRYRSIVQNYWSLARGAIVVFDLTSNDSFTAVRRWVSDFKAKACPPGSGRPRPPIMIIGNKMDLETERQVATSNARSYAVANGFFYTETSAKDDINVDIAFNVLLTEVYFETLKQQKPVLPAVKAETIPEPGFMEATVNTFARIGRSLSTKRKNTTPKNDLPLSGSPLGFRSGRESPFSDESAEDRRGRTAEVRSQSVLGHVKLDETFVSGARTLWKWVGDVVDDFVDEIEGVPVEPEPENDTEFFVNPVEFKTPKPYTGTNPLIGVVAPPGDDNGSDAGSHHDFESDDSDEGQIVMDFLSGQISNRKLRRPRIPPRSESSHSSPPHSPHSSVGNEVNHSNPTSPYFPPFSDVRRGSMAKILPRRESLAPTAILRTPPQSPLPGHSLNLRASPTPEIVVSPYDHDETAKSPLRSAKNHVVEVSTITPLLNGIEGDGARSLVESFNSMNIMDNNGVGEGDLGENDKSLKHRRSKTLL
ncbi:Ras- protein Rab-11A [Nowakowskiella sp. JEL0407]|nr:Ras- protein Rab-11A [Nowakowskiella sp. JEL0407]